MPQAEDLRVLAGIRLEGVLGSGRFGPVERGYHLTLKRPVAVRVFSPSVSEDEEAMARLESEARALAQLQHPGLVRVFDAGALDGRGYLVMELVEGTPLSRRLPLKLPDAVEMTRAVAEVLGWAHDRGVVHGGVSVHSVLVQEDGRVRVSDFALAPLAAGQAGLPQPEAEADVGATARLLEELVGGVALPRRFRAVVERATGQREPRVTSMRELVAALDDAMATRTLPLSERRWLRLIAAAQAVAAMVLLWVALALAAPWVLVRNALAPETVADPGRSWLGMALLAVGAVVLAGGGTAWLWRRWRAAGLDRGDPEKPLSAGDGAFLLGALALFTDGVRLMRIDALVAEGIAPPPSMPVLTLLWMVLALAFCGDALLEAVRRGRALKREGYLWAGLLLGLMPVVVELMR